MEVKKVKLSALKLNDGNPRIIKDFKFHQLVKSLLTFPEMLQLREIVTDEAMMVSRKMPVEMTRLFQPFSRLWAAARYKGQRHRKKSHTMRNSSMKRSSESATGGRWEKLPTSALDSPI